MNLTILSFSSKKKKLKSNQRRLERHKTSEYKEKKQSFANFLRVIFIVITHFRFNMI